jgi:N-acetylneuraminic acid mutarotase
MPRVCIFIFSVDSRTWKTIGDAEEAKSGSTAVVHNSQVYNFGGYIAGEYPEFHTTNKCFVADSELKTWNKLSDMMVDRQDGASVVYYA